MKRALVAVGLLAIVVALVAGCGGDDDSGGTAAPSVGGSGARVVLKGIAFRPSRIEIKSGDTVTWKWDDGGVIHDVKFDDFRSKLQGKGTYTHTFDAAGSFSYSCTVHPQMKGTVVVT